MQQRTAGPRGAAAGNAVAHRAALTRLRSALLALPETGENGFEGLVGAMLSTVAGILFRLAKSGTQGGEDGRGEDGSGAVGYEAKLYDSRLVEEFGERPAGHGAKSAVLNKAGELLGSSNGQRTQHRAAALRLRSGWPLLE